MRKYSNEFQSYVTAGVVEANANEMIFINNGSTTATINGLAILPGGTLSISGNGGEIDVSTYNLSFSATTGNKVDVIRKRYVS